MPILGTSPDAIDLAEDRDRFKALIEKLGPAAARERHRPHARRGARRRRADRLSRRDPPVLRARRPRHGDRRTTAPRSTATSRGCRRRSTGRPSWSSPSKRPLLIDRYLTDAIEVDVDCLCRRPRHLHRRHHGAHRGGRHPFGRQRLLAAAALARQPEADRRARAADARAGAGAERGRPDERAVRHQGRRDLHPRGQPARLAARCRSSPR